MIDANASQQRSSTAASSDPAAGQQLSPRDGVSAARVTQQTRSPDKRPNRWILFGLIAIVLLAAALRIGFLRQPMRYDEAVTYLEYVRPAHYLAAMMRKYRPNNHIFHTLLVYAAAHTLGASEWSLRLPALLAGVAIVPMTFIVFRRLFNRETGILAAALAAGSSPLVFFSANARGYSLIALLTLIALWAAARLVRVNVWWPWIVLALAIALGMWTVPVMLFPAAAVFVWLAAEGALTRDLPMRRLHWFLHFAACVAVTIALAALLYRPTLRAVGLHEITGNKYVRTLGIDRFTRELIVAPALVSRNWTADLPRPSAWLLHACALASVLLPTSGRRHRVPLLAAALVASMAVLGYSLRVPPTRVWIWLLPIYLGCAAATIVTILRWSLRNRPRLFTPTVSVTACLLAALLALRVWTGTSVRNSTDTGAFRDAPAVANLLKKHVHASDRIIASTPADGPLTFYLLRLGIDGPMVIPHTGRRVFIVLGRWEEADFATDSTIDQLAGRRGVAMKRYRAPQLLAHFPEADVYFATSRTAHKRKR